MIILQNTRREIKDRLAAEQFSVDKYLHKAWHGKTPKSWYTHLPSCNKTHKLNIYLHRIHTVTLITLLPFCFIPVWSHNSANSYKVVPFPPSLPPTSAGCCGSQWFAISTLPPFPHPTNSSCHHQRDFCRHWVQRRAYNYNRTGYVE